MKTTNEKNTLLIPQAKFSLGSVCLARIASETLPPREVFRALARHAQGDWGDLCREDHERNNQALQSGEERLFSSYHTEDGTKFWIITEWDRSVTTVLLPDEY